MFFYQYIREQSLPTTYYGAMNAGDVTFHSGWTLHKAFGNPTPNMREVMTVIYMEDGVQVATPITESREGDMASWLPGCSPGDLAAIPLNPLVYTEP